VPVSRSYLRRSQMTENRPSDFWDREIVQPTHVTWMEPLVVRHYINESISGHFGTWPFEWFEQNFKQYFPFECGLSIGCGGGHLSAKLSRVESAAQLTHSMDRSRQSWLREKFSLPKAFAESGIS